LIETIGSKISALKDRGWYLEFKPSDKELLNKMQEIINDVHVDVSLNAKQEVYNLIKKYSKFSNITLRTLIKGIFLYKECNSGKHLDWKSKLLNEMKVNPKLILINSLIEKHDSDKERIWEWETQGFSRRSYFDYKNKLKCKNANISKIPALLHKRNS